MTANNENGINNDPAGRLREQDIKSRKTLGRAFIFTASFMAIEAVGGWYSGSLALLSDAAHMLVDLLALAMNWVALTFSLRPADSRHTYGYYRIQVICAFINGLVLSGLCLWIIFEAIQRLLNPSEVMGGLMVTVAAAGLVVNLLVLRLLSGAQHKNLSHQAARLNVLGDTMGSVAAVMGGIVIVIWRFYYIDPLLSILISLIIANAARGMLKNSWAVLMESSQSLPMPEIICARIMQLPLVREVHHLHLWTLTPERPMITLHVKVNDNKDAPLVLRQVQKILLEEFCLSHATIQVESEDTFHEDQAELVLSESGDVKRD